MNGHLEFAGDHSSLAMLSFAEILLRAIFCYAAIPLEYVFEISAEAVQKV